MFGPVDRGGRGVDGSTPSTGVLKGGRGAVYIIENESGEGKELSHTKQKMGRASFCELLIA